MKKFDYVIFDFDGTVTDTGEGILKSLQYAFIQMGREDIPDLGELKKFIGPPIKYSFHHFYGVPEEQVGLYIEKYRERYKVKGIYECFVYEGFRETAEYLREQGVKLAISSSKPLHLIYDVMEHLEISHLFDAVSGVTLDDSDHSGKKELIENSMVLLGAADKNRVLMVGDRYFDIDGAVQAGVKSCGALWGYGSREEFIEHKADYIISAPEELKAVVSG